MQEYDNAAGGFEDGQTYVVWNRRFPPTPFTHSVDGGVTTISTGAGGITLTYTGGPFTSASLSIRMAQPNWDNNSEWTYGSSSQGNLFGTFHNLDGLNGWQDMNCSNPDNGALGPDRLPNGTQHDQASYGHYWCAMGLISKSGWAIVDDSRSPLFTKAGDSTDGWLAPQHKGQCALDIAENIPCLAPSTTHVWKTTAALGATVAEQQQRCEAAGCCYVPPTPTPAPPHGLGPTVALRQYFGGNENVLTTDAHPPRQPGYSSVLGIVGYALAKEPSGAAPGEYNQLKLFYRASPADHWTTATAEDEKAAAAQGYSLVAPLAWVPVKPQGNFSAEIVLYYSPSRHDHYDSLNNCEEV